jgi:uncharacterized membrane protein
MDLRPALAQLADQYGLSPADTARLHDLAKLEQEPDGIARTIPFGIALLGATLVGLGIIFWIAANWGVLSVTGHFALLQGVVVVMLASALLAPRARLPLSMLACLAIGGLFAYFGQTYQTGADTWQLFAVWAALTLLLCFGVRHDALWLAWTLIAMTAIVLWMQLNTPSGWGRPVGAFYTPVHVAAWSAGLLISALFTAPLRRLTGAGAWSLRLAIILVTITIGSEASMAAFAKNAGVMTFWIGLATLLVMSAAFAQAALYDLVCLCVIGLALNVVAVCGVARLVPIEHSLPIIPMLVIAVCAMLLLAATAKFVLYLEQRRKTGGAHA